MDISLALLTVGSCFGYYLYKDMYPTIEDLKEKHERRERDSLYRIEIGKLSNERDEWERKCLEAGKIL